ncbi:MAG: hypothetical protein ACRDSH_20045, partial [Pseudonocardiaceae bacterium]
MRKVEDGFQQESGGSAEQQLRPHHARLDDCILSHLDDRDPEWLLSGEHMNTAPSPEAGLSQPELARMWADHRQPLPGDQLEQLLTRLVGRLVKAITTVPLDERAVVEVAAELVDHGLTDPRTIGHSIEMLGGGLPRLPELHHLAQPDAAVLKTLAVLASGYTEALRQHTVDEHATAVQTMQRAQHEAELELRICETRFREIFFTSAVGIAISTFDGTVVTANRAFADIV